MKSIKCDRKANSLKKASVTTLFYKIEIKSNTDL